MDDRGHIKRFESDEQAKKEGYKYSLSDDEARKLEQLAQESRVEVYLFNKFHQEVLGNRKVDPIEKARYLMVLKWASEFYNKV